MLQRGQENRQDTERNGRGDRELDNVCVGEEGRQGEEGRETARWGEGEKGIGTVGRYTPGFC